MTNGSLRFISSTQSGYSGILQIFINRVWAYVCDEKWNKYDGGVACRQMGFDGIEAVTSHHLVSSKYLGWLHNVRCFGGEKTLLQCQHDELIMSPCHSSSYVAAVCQRYFPTIGMVKLLHSLMVELPLYPMVELPHYPMVDLPHYLMGELPHYPMVELPYSLMVELPHYPMVELPYSLMVELPHNLVVMVELPHYLMVELPHYTLW